MDINTKLASFPLLDLPFDLIERVVSHMHSSCLVFLCCSSKLLKEISNSPWVWRNRIQKEKQKIICISADETEWKRIFFKAIQFVSLQQAVKYVKDNWSRSKDIKWQIILAPGVFMVNEPILLMPNFDISGLWDTPWSQKPEAQQTKLISSSNSIFRSESSGEVPGRVISIKNFIIEKSGVGSKGRVPCSLQKANFAIENCEFHSSAKSALFLRESTVTIKNCRFCESFIGVYCTKDSSVNATGCMFAKNITGFRTAGCKRPIVLENCSFMKNKNGVILGQSSVTSTIKKCRFAGNEEQGIAMRPGSECLLFENQLTNNGTGLVVFESAKVRLSKNLFMNNKRHGIMTRYDALIEFIADNEIKNNGVTGLSMPEHCAEKLFTQEELCKTNTFSGNKTDVVLYPKRPNYEILYRPGDSKEVITSNCAIAVSRYMCTFAATLVNLSKQQGYECRTCGHSAVCVVCAKRCHLGHALSPVTVSQFYCDCGAESQCKALNVLE